ncbi:MAG: nicotinate (nicotinamide) nucleotide adenylyltransferase [bacterium]|nr:nicotinate (nicotinamide) nucleotide adenylyltransferase [bacterium]
MRKVAIFGGRFDPPHLGHYWVVRQILDFRPDIGRVILVPAFQHQWKPAVATPEQRMAMLSFHTQKDIAVSDIELQREGVSYTIDTIRALKQEEKAEIFWIVGSDILLEFDRWEKKDELVKEATFLIFPRDPYHLPEKIPQGFEVLSDHRLITSNLSSTVIKQRRKAGLSLKGFVLPEVEQYIVEHGLYT